MMNTQSKNLGTFCCIQTFTAFLKIPIFLIRLREIGKPFQSQAPLNLNEFFSRESWVFLTIMCSFLLSLHKLSAKYSGSPVDLTLNTARRVWQEA